ncbi:site-specific integrase [Paraburkholderia acidiphila]|uniref:Phage integrase family protein n=1 Tax=Paraburkholderia acidiphila TaxID=2571747 RepID=A0A7Z2JCT7_9BURK|nr:hypothetical protein [Paraburkholderia acidiphila]QGZ59976.1 hypothetical protein FAZ97_34170 [Paraburkholderia acidiphila]
MEPERQALADKLRCFSPHRLRALASYALVSGTERVTVRDNLRHASIATISLYLHGNGVRRAPARSGIHVCEHHQP